MMGLPRGLLLFAAVALSGSAWSQARLDMDFEGDIRVQDAATGAGAAFQLNGRPGVPLSGPMGSARIATPEIQYEGGTAAQRSARIVADPMQPGNHVLEFRIAEPNVIVATDGHRKSRVQMNLYGNVAAHEMYLSVRLYLDPAMASLRDFPRRFDWLTLGEFWNGAPWTGDPHPFRITLNIEKPEAAAGSPLRLAVRTQAMRSDRRDFRDADLWQATDEAGELVFGQWMRLEYLIREGDATSGRFALALTPAGQARRVVFDLVRPTVHPDSPRRDGLRQVNPLKLYTSDVLTSLLADKGEALRVLWDDLQIEVCDNSPGGGPSECSVRWAGR